MRASDSCAQPDRALAEAHSHRAAGCKNIAECATTGPTVRVGCNHHLNDGRSHGHPIPVGLPGRDGESMDGSMDGGLRGRGPTDQRAEQWTCPRPRSSHALPMPSPVHPCHPHRRSPPRLIAWAARALGRSNLERCPPSGVRNMGGASQAHVHSFRDERADEKHKECPPSLCRCALVLLFFTNGIAPLSFLRSRERERVRVRETQARVSLFFFAFPLFHTLFFSRARCFDCDTLYCSPRDNKTDNTCARAQGHSQRQQQQQRQQ